MGFWSTLGSRILYGPVEKSVSGITGWTGWGAQTAAGIRVNTLNSLQQSAVLAATTILSEDIAKLDVNVYRKLDNGGKVLAKDLPLYRLLNYPNEQQTKYEFIQQMMGCLCLASNAYAVILRDGTGNPTSLFPIHPDRIAIQESPDGEIFYNVTTLGNYERSVLREVANHGAFAQVHQEDMLHLRWMSSISTVYGMDRVSLMKENIGLSLALEESTSRLIAKAARPGGNLKLTQKYDRQTKEQMVADFVAAHSGPNNSGGISVLDPGTEYEAIEYSTDPEVLKTRSFELANIFRMMRIPLFMAGIIETGDKSDQAAINQAYINNTLSPWMTNWCQRLAKTFDLDEPYFVEFDVENFMKTDIETRYNSLRAAILGGIISTNEARAALNMPRVPFGDIILRQQNMVPLGTPPATNGDQGGIGSDSTGSPAPGGDGDPAKPPEDTGEPAGDTAAPTD